MKSDIEIARSIELTKIKQIAPRKPEFLLNTLVIMADI